MQNKKFLSVIIATYNRCESLKDTLSSFLDQECDGSFDYEIIIVDNNSIDKTKDMVQSYFSKFNCKLKYIFEQKQGKTYALNKGIDNARGEIIAFTDDDCIPDKSWLKNINEIFKGRDSDLLGGKVIPIFNSKIPKWLNLEKMGGPLVYQNFGDQFLENNEKRSFAGANISVKKSSISKFGTFKDHFRSQDVEFCLRWNRLGARIAYHPNIVVYHKTEPHRLRKNYFRKWHFLLGEHQSVRNKEKYCKDKCFFNVPLWMYGELISNTIQFIKGTVFLKSNTFLNELEICFILGRMLGLNGYTHIFKNIR